MRVPLQSPGAGRGSAMRRRLRVEALLPSCAACDAAAESYADDHEADAPDDADGADEGFEEVESGDDDGGDEGESADDGDEA